MTQSKFFFSLHHSVHYILCLDWRGKSSYYTKEVTFTICGSVNDDDSGEHLSSLLWGAWWYTVSVFWISLLSVLTIFPLFYSYKFGCHWQSIYSTCGCVNDDDSGEHLSSLLCCAWWYTVSDFSNFSTFSIGKRYDFQWFLQNKNQLIVGLLLKEQMWARLCSDDNHKLRVL